MNSKSNTSQNVMRIDAARSCNTPSAQSSTEDARAPKALNRNGCTLNCLTAFFVALMLFATPCFARRIYVKRTAPAGGHGGSWDTAYQSLRDAVNAAASGDIIGVARGTYLPPNQSHCTFPSRLTIYGGFAGGERRLRNRRLSSSNESVISPATTADQNETLIEVSNYYTLTLDGITFTRVDTAEEDVAIVAATWRSDLRLRNCTFRNNHLQN